MKKILIVLIMFIGNLTIAQTAYSKGFEKGFKKGYCHNKGFACTAPLTPVQPISSIGKEDNYNEGYNAGFALGIEKSKSDDNDVSGFETDYDMYKGSKNGYPVSESNDGQTNIRMPAKFNKPTSRINHKLIAEVLRKKQEAIDREIQYLNSLSYEERKAILQKRIYSRRKSHIYGKNLNRLLKANKKAKKTTKNHEKQLKKNEKKFLNSKLLKVSEITNGWHNTIVNIWSDGKANFVKRMVYVENGVITKYIGGTGFMAYIKAQVLRTDDIIELKVGYEDNDKALIYVSFIENNPKKLKEDPTYPVLLKFYTTINDEGKFFVYVNNKNYSDYFTLHNSFKKGVDISCEQTKGIVTFYLKPNSFYSFYAHSSLSEWEGSIDTFNRYCIIKELSN